jgi:hypothetical protein
MQLEFLMTQKDIAKVHKRHETHIARLSATRHWPKPKYVIGNAKLYEPTDIDAYFARHPIARRKRRAV